jgi:hypothetical protein
MLRGGDASVDGGDTAVACNTDGLSYAYFTPGYQSDFTARQAFTSLDYAARRRIPARRRVAFMRLAVWLVLAGLFADTCAQIGSSSTWPLLLILGVTLAATTWSIDNTISSRIITRYMHHRDALIIDYTSRTKLRQDRANRRADLKAGIIGGAAGSVATALITLAATGYLVK